ncbi:NADH dehydrogenase FAD-containing subunit [Halobacteriales archaeon QS_1_68_20]|nr:MAG: NADH dehydrogenase FAD-containing subunit [Halobacteriales archaeon QS_1_68_20]
MAARVVVLGAGYAGTTVVRRLQQLLDGHDLTWVSREDYHLVLHEVHRAIGDPDAAEKLTVPRTAIADRSTDVLEGEVVGVDTDDRTVALADDRELDYDYLVVALGSKTAFYGIPGLEEHALTLKGLDDALDIHESVVGAARDATPQDPARVVVGGAGLSGIQTAGEVAELRDEWNLPIEITLVEAMEEILPGNDPALQQAVRERVEARGVNVLTDDPIVEATGDAIRFDEGDPLDYDILVWTGGITGQDSLDGANLETNHNRVETDATFRTSDDRVFAVGDSALVEQGDDVAPPTAQAAWQAGDVLAENVVRAMAGRPLETWTFEDEGTVLSVGASAVAHEVLGTSIGPFDGFPARFLKKFIAARWLKDVASYRRAIPAWSVL